MVRGLMSETSLMGISDDKNQQVGLPTHRVSALTLGHIGFRVWMC